MESSTPWIPPPPGPFAFLLQDPLQPGDRQARWQCSEGTRAELRQRRRRRGPAQAPLARALELPALMMVIKTLDLTIGLLDHLLSHWNICYKSPRNPDEGSTLRY